MIMVLQEPALAVGGPTVADDLLVLHGAHLVIVVPAELLPCGDKLKCEEGDAGEPEVVAVHEHILHEHIRVTAVVQIPSNISLCHCIHYVNIFIGSKIFSDRFVFWLVSFLFFRGLWFTLYGLRLFWDNLFKVIIII